MILTKHTRIVLLFFSVNMYALAQEEQNDEATWKLYPNDSTEVINETSILDTTNIGTLTISSGPAFVEIVQDYRVKQLLEKDKYLNEKNDPLQIDGYRIKIYFGSGANSQKEANQAKARFLEKFSKTKIYVKWTTPNYTTSVGNFRTKMDAEKFLKEMSVDFPEGFIVPSKIDLPELR
ncbi:MAG: SPOR domain-containing protein [Flavobacteriales bacterium]|nr:SPOR domain-containing protein [Flavobacteriales bacterium]